MTGVQIEITGDIDDKLLGIVQRFEHPAPLFADINEHLLRSTRGRFRSQQAPGGTPWAPLSAQYQRRKRRNANRILTLDGYLQGTLTWPYWPIRT